MRRTLPGVAAGALALSLAACGRLDAPAPGVRAGAAPEPPALSAVADGSYVRAVRMSGLLVTPGPAAAAGRLGLTWQRAAALFEATTGVQGSHTAAMLGYGLVTLSGSALPASIPHLRRRAAWVGITWGGVASCPAETPSSGSPAASGPARRPIFTAVVIYGSGGNGALVYSSRGTPLCGGPEQGPTAVMADETLSVPWREIGPVRKGLVRVSYRAPACARPFSTSAGGDVRTGAFTITVEVSVPAARSACRGTAVRTSAISVLPPPGAPGLPTPPPRLVLAHGRTGLVPVLQAGRPAGAPSRAAG